MLLRIEDTDRERSSEEAVRAIYDGLEWLGLNWDGEAVSQFARADRHAEVANLLLAEGKAYRCYATPEELTEMRNQARAEGRSTRYDGRWRDRDPADAPAGVDPVIRLKALRDGATVIEDLVQGSVTVQNTEMDDMVLLRSDGTPTYMLAVVVDDHDMNVSHVIRGDDHLTNAIRQRQLYDQLDWPAPVFAHIPLIHGPDGSKLSKRHGALGVQAYREMGYLPEALCNYLLRLGWSHGDDEIISRAQAIDWFDLDAVGKSPARIDFAKLESVNAHYIKIAAADVLIQGIVPLLEERLGDLIGAEKRRRLANSLPDLRERAKTVNELADVAWYCVAPRPLEFDAKAAKALDDDSRALLGKLATELLSLEPWTKESLEAAIRSFADTTGVKFGKVAQPLRAALTGSSASPGIFDVLVALERQESLDRINDVVV
jgi:glutamyl-tRNA synthetase